MGVADIMARVGGLSASILPILRITGPLIVLWFLINLSNILREAHKKDYNSNIINFMKLTIEKLTSLAA